MAGRARNLVDRCGAPGGQVDVISAIHMEEVDEREGESVFDEDC